MSKTIEVGRRILTVKGTEGSIVKILDGGYLLDSGKRIRAESIALVLPSIDPTYYYVGHRWRKKYGGMPLKLHPELRDGGKRCFIMPDGYYTTWLDMSEVRQQSIRFLV